MGLLSGSVSVTRFQVARSAGPDFEAAAFREIAAGSEVRESMGFVPFEPEEPYEIGAGLYAFRVRIDKLRPDPTAVQERLKQLVKTELEATGAAFAGPKKRRELRFLAEAELLSRTSPRSKIVECALDGTVVYVGSTARGVLGTVRLLLSRAGVDTAPKTPWHDRGLPELLSEIVEVQDQAESVYGCRFLKALVGDPDFLVEPEEGRVRLATREARISLTGEVLADLHRYLERDAEVVAAKLLSGDTRFTLDAPGFRISGLSLAPSRTGHWTNDLLQRIEQVADLFERLEKKFVELGVG